MRISALFLFSQLVIGTSAAEPVPAEIESALRREANLSLNLGVQMGVSSKSAMVRFAVIHHWDVGQEISKLRGQLETNTARGLVRSNLVVMRRLAQLMDDRDAREAARLRNQRERVLKELHRAEPDNLELAMDYAGALPGFMNYKKRSMYRELSAQHPERPEPLLAQATLVFGDFIKKGLGVQDGNWLAAMARLKAISQDSNRDLEPFLQNFNRQLKLANTAVNQLLDEALKRDPGNVEARMHKASFEWLHKMFLVIDAARDFSEKGEDERIRLFDTSTGILNWLRENQELIRSLHRGEPFEHAAPFAIDVMGALLGHIANNGNGGVVEALKELAPRWREQARALESARRGLRVMAEQSPKAEHRSVALFWLGLAEIVEGRREAGLKLLEQSLMTEPFEALSFYSYERSDEKEYDAAIKAMMEVLARRDFATVRIHLAHFQIKAGRREALMENAEWFRKEVPEDGIHDLIQAAHNLRSGGQVQDAVRILKPLATPLPAPGGKVRPYQKDAIVMLMICRALNRDIEGFDELRKWCRMSRVTGTFLERIDKAFDQLR